MQFLAVLQRYFEDLIDEVRVSGELIQNLFEHFDLHVKIHPVWSVQTDQPSVYLHVGVLSSRSRTGWRSAKVDRVSGHEGPVTIENEGFQFDGKPPGAGHGVDVDEQGYGRRRDAGNLSSDARAWAPFVVDVPDVFAQWSGDGSLGNLRCVRYGFLV